ncbi:hypothetical protein BJY04DRAFT_178406 [Aspergillus karnatakaensis]|uniref:uncharacterized protein n=1 Tax=Aspergillus karnatakaensis TaxID=1810916 RepID=UPI003CCE38BB
MASHRKHVTAVPMPEIEARKGTDFWAWYREVLVKGEMTETGTPKPGCLLLRPGAHAIWERLCTFLRGELTSLGVRDFSLPLPASPDTSTPDASVDDGLSVSDPNSEPPIASTLYPLLAKWIKTERDLPLRLNQFTCRTQNTPDLAQGHDLPPQPLIQDRTCLVQEAHTAYLTHQDSLEEMEQVIAIYTRLFTDFLAIPITTKRYQTAMEASPSSGAAHSLQTAILVGTILTLGVEIEIASCRQLGQTWSRKYHIVIPSAHGSGSTTSPTTPAADPNQPDTPTYVWQNTFTITSATIGLLAATHGDNRGLIIPPRVSDSQIVLIPYQDTRNVEWHPQIHTILTSVHKDLLDAGVRVIIDGRTWRSANWKFHEWSVKGVPLLIVVGSEEARGGYVTVDRRDLSRGEAKRKVKVEEVGGMVAGLLEDIQVGMLERAREALE